MRMRPSQSRVMKLKVGIDLLAHDRKVNAVVRGDARPIMHAGAAHGVDPQCQSRALDDIKIDDMARSRT
jgi:hypothetical protein